MIRVTQKQEKDMPDRFPNQNQTANFEDKTLTCCDANCGQTFVFTARDQAFYAENNYSEPRRCRPCRDARKAQRGPSPNGYVGPSPQGPSGHSPGQNKSGPNGYAPPARFTEEREGGGRKKGRRNRDDDFDNDWDDGYRRRR